MELFLQDAFEFEEGEEGGKEILSLLDSTKGMSQMVHAMEQDREEAKEEEYDYFLDAHKDENLHENKGYHIID